MPAGDPRGDRAWRQIRRILALPTAESELWATLSENQRLVVTTAAGLPVDRAGGDWGQFTPGEQARICEQIDAFGRIAKQLRAIRRRPWGEI